MLVTISTKLSFNKNKNDVIMSKLGKLTLNITFLRKEYCELKAQIDIL